MKRRKNIFKYIFFLFIILLLVIIVYAYNSGSCEKNDNSYNCDDTFCLHKEFKISLHSIENEIENILLNKEIQKKVSIKIYPETLGNCALPNRSGITISTQDIFKNSSNIIDFYQNELRTTISTLLGFEVQPTELKYPTSCAIIIYENENDWINWHYDYNYYNGRFFTVLIPITHDLTCTKFEFKDGENVVSLDMTNNAICFEGNYLYHRASKLCNGQKRVMLSCQYVTDNTMSLINSWRIKLKDYAFIGKLF